MAQHKSKRERRKQDQKRILSQSPYRLAGTKGEVEACYINADWREDGKASIYLLRRSPHGNLIMGAFLVDLWCMGLKDAFGHLDVTHAEFREHMNQAPDSVDLARVDMDTVRWIVAGGIRFARQNGFRLPPRFERWTALLGKLDESSVDMTRFGLEGKIVYVGSRVDLEKRLIGSTLAEFLNRPDVEVDFDGTDFTLLDKTHEDVNELIDRLGSALIAGTRRWCFSRGIAPHPRLMDAVDMLLESITQAGALLEDDDPDEKIGILGSDVLAAMFSMQLPEDQPGLAGAFEQMRSFQMEFSSVDQFGEAVGLPLLDEEDK